jgi:hypothetical protein
MKKLSVFIIVSFFALALSAQQVTVRTYGNYEVKIDGRGYYTNQTVPLNYGSHSIGVYQLSNGLFGIRRRTLVSSSSFDLRNNDVVIQVDQYGQARISQSGNYGYNNGQYNNGQYNNGQYNNGQYRNYNGQGRGRKNGWYKNKKNRRYDRDDNRRNDRDDR